MSNDRAKGRKAPGFYLNRVGRMMLACILVAVAIWPVSIQPQATQAAPVYAPQTPTPPALPTPTPTTTPPLVGEGEAAQAPHTPPSPDNLPPEVEKTRARQPMEALLAKYLRYWGPRYQVAPVEVAVEGEWAHGVAQWQSQIRALSGWFSSSGSDATSHYYYVRLYPAGPLVSAILDQHGIEDVIRLEDSVIARLTLDQMTNVYNDIILLQEGEGLLVSFESVPWQTYEMGLQSWEVGQPAEVEERTRAEVRAPGVVAIVVDQSIYNNIQSALSTYISDVTSRWPNLTLLVYESSAATSESLRGFLQNIHQNQSIQGAILVGSLPYAEWELPWGEECSLPLFYEDLDGVFLDQDSDGLYDYRDWGSNEDVEIWVSWIRPPSQYAVSALQAYFQKTHNYYSGAYPMPERGLLVISYDWSGCGDTMRAAFEELYDDRIDQLGGDCRSGAMVSKYRHNSGMSIDDSFHLAVDGDRLLWQVATGESWGSTKDSTYLSDGQWHHIAVTWDGDEQTIYVDGQVDIWGTFGGDISGPINPTEQSISLGRTIQFGEPRQYYEGQIDEVRIWDVVRTEAEIKSAMFQPLEGNEPRLKAYWPMDEATGSTVVHDVSDHGNDGTLQGGASLVSSDAPLSMAGNALSLNGTDGYVSVPDTDSLDGFANMTIEAWVKPRDRDAGLCHAKLEAYLDLYINNDYGVQNLWVHSSNTGHQFDAFPGEDNWLTSSELAALTRGPQFSVIWGCHAMDFSGDPDTIFATRYLMGTHSGLAALGVTRTIGTPQQEYLVSLLPQTANLGDAMFQYLNLVTDQDYIYEQYPDELHTFVWDIALVGDPFMFFDTTSPTGQITSPSDGAVIGDCPLTISSSMPTTTAVGTIWEMIAPAPTVGTGTAPPSMTKKLGFLSMSGTMLAMKSWIQAGTSISL
jgi:hypothetical protein